MQVDIPHLNVGSMIPFVGHLHTPTCWELGWLKGLTFSVRGLKPSTPKLPWDLICQLLIIQVPVSVRILL